MKDFEENYRQFILTNKRIISEIIRKEHDKTMHITSDFIDKSNLLYKPLLMIAVGIFLIWILFKASSFFNGMAATVIFSFLSTLLIVLILILTLKTICSIKDAMGEFFFVRILYNKVIVDYITKEQQRESTKLFMEILHANHIDAELLSQLKEKIQKIEQYEKYIAELEYDKYTEFDLDNILSYKQ